MVDYCNEFEKLVSALTSTYIDINVIYKESKERHLFGITYLGTNNRRIVVYVPNKTNFYYKSALITLIHEYGHVVDEYRHEGCKRLKDYYAIIDYSFIKKYFCSIVKKRHYLLTEYLATKYGSILLQKFNVKLDKDELLIDQTVHFKFLYENIMNKFEMSYIDVENYKKDIINNGFRINSKIIRNIRGV